MALTLWWMRITLLKLIAVAQPSDSTSLELGLNPRVDFSNKFPDRCCYCYWFTLQTIGLNIDYSEFPGANGDWLKENTTLHCEVLLNSHQENRHWSITESPSKTGATWIAHPGFCQAGPCFWRHTVVRDLALPQYKLADTRNDSRILHESQVF